MERRDLSVFDPLKPGRPGWRFLAGLLVAYSLAIVATTFPTVLHFDSRLPTATDPLTHLWTMKWYKTCLIEGRSPFSCPEIQYPVGAPLGHLPPMQFQSLLYLPLSCVIKNDILCYNIIWFLAFLLMGFGTFGLIWHLLRDRLCAGLGGMLAMVSTPMLWFAHSELEQISVGWFPLFLIAWMRWIDRPSRGRMASTILLLIMLTMSAPYFVVLSVFPTSLYLAWSFLRVDRPRRFDWLLERVRWLSIFVGLFLPVFLVLFSSQIWAAAHGFSIERSKTEFYGTPILSYLIPLPPRLEAQFSNQTYLQTGLVGGVQSYLGIVTLALVSYAAIARLKFPNRSFWWICLGALFVLSLGRSLSIFGQEIPLPGYYLRTYFFAFKHIRVPARFNLLVAVITATIAASALQHLLRKFQSLATRSTIVGVLGLLAIADLAWVPFGSFDPPEVPAGYEFVLKKKPDAVLLEVPQFNAGPYQLPAVLTYWQSFHRARTSAGHTAFRNDPCDDLMLENSPFHAHRLAQEDYLEDPESVSFDFIQDTTFRDYAWLYLNGHGFDYVIVHHAPGAFPELPIHLEALKAAMAEAKVFEDEKTAVYEVAKLPVPRKLTLLCKEGWKQRMGRNEGMACAVAKEAVVLAYNPDPEKPLTLTLRATTNKRPRVVKLMDNEQEIARWEVHPEKASTLKSPHFQLPAGISSLTLQSDGDERPSTSDAISELSTKRFSLWIYKISAKAEDGSSRF